MQSFRQHFRIPVSEGREQLYFLGNSLGLQPLGTAEKLDAVLQQWATLGVEGFFEGTDPWMEMHARLAAKMAPIVGALPGELSIMNALTENLHLLMQSFYQPNGKRRKILCEQKAFPSDQYMLETLLKSRGLDPADILVEIGADQEDGDPAACISTAQLLAAIQEQGEELALVFLGGVNYYTGQVFDIASITAAAHQVGAIAGFDLAHAAGNISLELHQWDVDFAAWCNYKYLNGGPGAVATAFIHERYHAQPGLNRAGGWWGHNKASRFRMEKGFQPEQAATGWQLSTPPILLYAALEASLDLFEKAGVEQLNQSAEVLFQRLIGQLEPLQEKLRILTPLSKGDHGCQLSLYFPNNGRTVFEQLRANGVFADWREPGVIRVAPVPLYNTLDEVDQFAEILRKALI